MWVKRKNARTIFKSVGYSVQPAIIFSLFITIYEFSSYVRDFTSTLEIYCNRIEPKLIDCQFTTIPKLEILPPSTQTYKGIKKVTYLMQKEEKEDTKGHYHTGNYIVFNQTSGENRVQFNDSDRAQWVANQIDQFLNSGQETIKFTKSANLANLIIKFVKSVVEFTVIFFILLILLPVLDAVHTFFRWFLLRHSRYTYINPLNYCYLYRLIEIDSNLRKVVDISIGIPFCTKTLNFSDIRAVTLIKKEWGGKSYTLCIRTNKNEEIYLWSVYTSKDENEETKKICNQAREISELAGSPLVKQLVYIG